MFCNWKGSKKLTVLGHLGAAEVDLITEPIAFIAACYRSKVQGVTPIIISWVYTQPDPPELDIMKYECHVDENGTALYPSILPPECACCF